MTFRVQSLGGTGGGVAPVSPLRMPGIAWFDDVADASTVIAGGRVTQLRNLATSIASWFTPDPAGVGPLVVARGIGGAVDMAWDGGTTALRGDGALRASIAFSMGALFVTESNAGILFGGGDYFGVTYSLEIGSLGAVRCVAGNPAAGGAEAVTRAKYIDGKPHSVIALWDSSDGVGNIVLQVDGLIAPLAVDTPSTAALAAAGDLNAVGATCHLGVAPATYFQGLSPMHWMLDRRMSDAELAQAFAFHCQRAKAQ